jgi:hypothetical protein
VFGLDRNGDIDDLVGVGNGLGNSNLWNGKVHEIGDPFDVEYL